MYAIPLLVTIEWRIRILEILIQVLIVLAILRSVQIRRSNHLLRSIDASLKTLPAVSQARNLAAVKKHAVG